MNNAISQYRLLETKKIKKIKNATTFEHIHLLCGTFSVDILGVDWSLVPLQGKEVSRLIPMALDTPFTASRE